MGGPMTEAARRMGLTPRTVQHDYTYQLSEYPVELDNGRIIEPGQATGTYETVRFVTDEGIEFEGVIQVVPIPVDEAGGALEISGNPDLHTEYRPFPDEELTNNGLLNRIPDIISAPPGLHFSAEMPKARHQLPRIQQVADQQV